MPAPLLEPPPHGTRRRYQWRRGRCRCDKCKLANRTYVYSRRFINARTGDNQPLPLAHGEAGPRRTAPTTGPDGAGA